MNFEVNLIPNDITGLMENLNNQLKKFTLKETEWLMQKYQYETKISELEGQVKAHENVNIDLLKRVRMLEYALTQERIKNNNNKIPEGGGTTTTNYKLETTDILMSNKVELEIKDNRELISEEELKIIKEKSIRPSLIKYL
jgi:hypothetical protein